MRIVIYERRVAQNFVLRCLIKLVKRLQIPELQNAKLCCCR